jgi:hypothetical protein
MLLLKPLAIALAENQTLGSYFFNTRLRFALKRKHLNEFISLLFKEIKINRLQYRLQTCKLSVLIGLQAQAVLVKVYKQKCNDNQSIYKILFAKNSN